jgi:hypothetical protein
VRPNNTLGIVDVVAPRIPTLVKALAALGVQPRQVEAHFPPDRLGWAGTAIRFMTSTDLMVRGDLEPLEPFMIPETAAF